VLSHESHFVLLYFGDSLGPESCSRSMDCLGFGVSLVSESNANPLKGECTFVGHFEHFEMCKVLI
jgi:hypothetical protein